MYILLVLPLLVGLLALTSGPDAGNVSDPNRPYEPDSVTVALYHFDQGDDSVAVDASNHHLDARIAGAESGAGRFGNGVWFDNRDYILVPLTAASVDATYEAWVYLTADSTFDMIVIDRSDVRVRSGRGLYIKGNRIPVAYATYEQVFRVQAEGSSPLPTNKWVHLAAIFSETSARIDLAVNGVVVSSQPLACCTADFPSYIAIGREASREAFYFNGRIDEVRVSSTARQLEPVAVEGNSWGEMKRLWR